MIILKYIGTFVVILVVVIIIGILLKKEKSTTPNYYNKQIKNVKVQNTPSEIEEHKDQYRIGVTFKGDKSQITDLIEGNATFDISHFGYSHFTAHLLKPDGTLIAVLADVDGSYKGTKTVKIPETGIYIFDVKTTGEWSFSRK
jgi:hypothetical protein